jgi:hypothetical protein
MKTSLARPMVALILLCAAGASLPARAQISVRGGNPLLSITTGTAAGQPVAVTNVTSSLRWTRQTVITKITVSTSCPGQRFTLSVTATNLSYGVAAPVVTLINGVLASDFVISIPTGGPQNKTCTLQYTASATFAQGNSTELGNDVHTVTYTLVAQ